MAKKQLNPTEQKPNQENLPVPESQKKNLGQKISFQLMVTLLVLATLVAIAVNLGTQGIEIVKENKLRDVWAIQFLELERSGNRLLGSLQDFRQSAREAVKTNNQVNQVLKAAFRIESLDESLIEYGSLGVERQSYTPSDFGVENFRELDSLSILQIDGLTYLLTVEPSSYGLFEMKLSTQFLFLWNLDTLHFTANKGLKKSAEESSEYLLSRSGQLITSNDPKILPTNVQSRPLVQNFIQASINQGQFRFAGELGEDMIGFYYRLPATNLVFFSENNQSVIYEKVAELMFEYALMALVTLIIGIALLQFPLRYIILPLKQLTQSTSRLAQGDFSQRFKARGIGEIGALSDSFSKMIVELDTRDKEIFALMDEKAERIRLQHEINLAGQIQTNFLPTQRLKSNPRMKVAVSYTPASEACGDWYNYYYDEESGEGVCILADVSGHGAGSAMFTAIIAGFFAFFVSDEDRKLMA